MITIKDDSWVVVRDVVPVNAAPRKSKTNVGTKGFDVFDVLFADSETRKTRTFTAPKHSAKTKRFCFRVRL